MKRVQTYNTGMNEAYMNDTPANTVAEPAAPHWTLSVLHAAHLIEERIEGALSKIGLSMAKQGALGALATAGEPLTLGQLAGRLSCVRSNITQLVDRLEADGFVKRVADPEDRRSIRVELTPLGRERHRSGERAMKRVQTEFASKLTGGERSALEAALGALD
jgi:DNA-binding MarR family transcriptional regulator